MEGGDSTHKTAVSSLNGLKNLSGNTAMEEKVMIQPQSEAVIENNRNNGLNKNGISIDIDGKNFDSPPKNFSPCGCISVVAQLVLVSLTASFLFGYNVAVLNPVKNYIILEFEWCKTGTQALTKSELIECSKATTYGTLINGVVFVGATVGAMSGGYFLSFGRRFCIMLTHLLFICGGIMSIASEGFWSLFLARLVVGLGIGFSSVIVGVWVAENSPKQSRGFWGVFIQLAITVGILTANLFGLAFGEMNKSEIFVGLTSFEKVWWRVLLGLSIVPSSIGLILIAFVYKYDTPHYLLEEGRENVAKALIGEIYAKESEDKKEEEFKEIKNAVREMKIVDKNSLGIFEAMKNKGYRNVIIIGCVLSIGQQLTGINVVVSNSNRLYDSANVTVNVQLISVILTLVNMLMTFPPIFLIERLGRKTLLIIGTAGQAICLFPGLVASWIKPVTSATGWVAIVSTYGYIIFFAMAYGPVLWVYLFEIFPIEIKKRAASLAVACNWLGSIIIVLPSDYYIQGNSSIVFTLFFVMCTLMLVFIIIFTKESKGRSIDNSPYFDNAESSRVRIINNK